MAVILCACGEANSTSDATAVKRLPSMPSTSIAAPPPLQEIVIICHTAYRSSVSHPIEQSDTRSVASSAPATISYRDLTFSAQSLLWFGEGQSLKLAVTATGQRDELTTILYQFPNGKPVVNQFKGGHGFTGLHYAYHPKSRAELQFWCAATE